jgi:endothelin-converting enzyme
MQLKAVEKSADEENFDKMKAAYDACLNEDHIKSVGAKPLMEALSDIQKVYPASDSKNSGEHALKNAIHALTKYGITSLVSTGVGADDTDPDTVVVSVSAPYSFGLPSKERYEDDKLVEKYRSVAVEVLSSLYPDQDKDLFAKVIDLEKKLAAASPASEDRDDVTVCISPQECTERRNFRDMPPWPTTLASNSMCLLPCCRQPHFQGDRIMTMTNKFIAILQPNAD